MVKRESTFAFLKKWTNDKINRASTKSVEAQIFFFVYLRCGKPAHCGFLLFIIHGGVVALGISCTIATVGNATVGAVAISVAANKGNQYDNPYAAGHEDCRCDERRRQLGEVFRRRKRAETQYADKQ